MAKPKRGLGKGLEALFADNDTSNVSVSTMALGEIEPNPEQPRREFTPEALSQLADSIKEHGVLQPLMELVFHGAAFSKSPMNIS